MPSPSTIAGFVALPTFLAETVFFLHSLTTPPPASAPPPPPSRSTCQKLPSSTAPTSTPTPAPPLQPGTLLSELSLISAAHCAAQRRSVPSILLRAAWAAFALSALAWTVVESGAAAVAAVAEFEWAWWAWVLIGALVEVVVVALVYVRVARLAAEMRERRVREFSRRWSEASTAGIGRGKGREEDGAESEDSDVIDVTDIAIERTESGQTSSSLTRFGEA